MNLDKRREALRRLIQRQGDDAEREQAARTQSHYWVDPQRAVSLVALALEEEADFGRRLLGYDSISDEDVDAALMAIVDARTAAVQRELIVLHAARARGRTWEQIAELLSHSLPAPTAVTAAQAKARFAALRKKYPHTAGQLLRTVTSTPSAPSEPS
ncbi:hypothetical protein [Nonomuraea sp. NPDC005692]|uniref:hypothetical protein n=1 Tax=Nonomuraea sp. NPDC005692 TaxID=3157168 RepID=UPI0033F687A6